MGSKLPHSYYLLAHCPTNMHIALPDSCHLTLPSGLSQSCCCLLLPFRLISVKATVACFSSFISSQSKLLLPASPLSSHLSQSCCCLLLPFRLISVKATAACFFSFISSHLSQSCCCLLLLFHLISVKAAAACFFSSSMHQHSLPIHPCLFACTSFSSQYINTHCQYIPVHLPALHSRRNTSTLTANTSLSICLHFILVAIQQHSLPIHPCPFACTPFSSQYINTHCQYIPVHLPALHSRRNTSALTANTSLSICL